MLPKKKEERERERDVRVNVLTDWKVHGNRDVEHTYQPAKKEFTFFHLQAFIGERPLEKGQLLLHSL